MRIGALSCGVLGGLDLLAALTAYVAKLVKAPAETSFQILSAETRLSFQARALTFFAIVS
jgi:hypothetical protein